MSKPRIVERVLVKEPDLTTFELWLASNPPYADVARWLAAIEGYMTRPLHPRTTLATQDEDEV